MTINSSDFKDQDLGNSANDKDYELFLKILKHFQLAQSKGYIILDRMWWFNFDNSKSDEVSYGSPQSELNLSNDEVCGKISYKVTREIDEWHKILAGFSKIEKLEFEGEISQVLKVKRGFDIDDRIFSNFSSMLDNSRYNNRTIITKQFKGDYIENKNGFLSRTNGVIEFLKYLKKHAGEFKELNNYNPDSSWLNEANYKKFNDAEEVRLNEERLKLGIIDGVKSKSEEDIKQVKPKLRIMICADDKAEQAIQEEVGKSNILEIDFFKSRVPGKKPSSLENVSQNGKVWGDYWWNADVAIEVKASNNKPWDRSKKTVTFELLNVMTRNSNKQKIAEFIRSDKMNRVGEELDQISDPESETSAEKYRKENSDKKAEFDPISLGDPQRRGLPNHPSKVPSPLSSTQISSAEFQKNDSFGSR